MKNSVRLVSALFLLSVLALIVTGSSIYFRLSFLWAVLLIGGQVWARTALRGVHVTRRARTRRAQMGHIFEERFQIRNTGRLPRLWLEIRDQSTLPGSQASRVLARIGRRQGRSYLARTRLTRRGVFPLGPTILASGDPFGLFRVSRTLPADASLLVYPMTVELYDFPSPPGLLPGGEALNRRTQEVTPNAAGVREYAPGDPRNRIHWASTARRERLMVKEFELDPLAEVWIVVDAGQEVQAALPFSPPARVADMLWQPLEKVKLPPSTEEYAVTIAASLGRYFLRRGRAVGLVSYDQSLNEIPPDRGGRQLGKILEALALLRARGDLSIAALVTAQAQHLPRGSTVILITPTVHADLAVAADILVRRGLFPVIVLLDAASFGGPPGTAALGTAMRALGVPVCPVGKGMDLAAALSSTGG